MADSIARFFEGLNHHGHEARLEKLNGTVRIELHDNGHSEHWLVTVKRGEITVTREDHVADATIYASPELFGRIVRGEANAISALLRGEMSSAGDLQLVVRLERILPGPPDAHGPYRRTEAGRVAS
ncbi:SCP2 sterol-binding domain-containing protein [Polymorphospora sp. NPDC050346]|uniref:SCP2 sterol-binding domain-containing protein n=1 Tax=Polymorphospora sp. NPDC050346 TaxID=3155780 RepID=UPI0033E93069